MELGPHAGFIVAAYATAAIVIGALVAWVVVDYRALARALAEIEAKGMGRPGRPS
jgi:heme exporter protein D